MHEHNFISQEIKSNLYPIIRKKNIFPGAFLFEHQFQIIKTITLNIFGIRGIYLLRCDCPIRLKNTSLYTQMVKKHSESEIHTSVITLLEKSV